MKKNNILFLAPGIWSLGERKGMPSVSNTLKGFVRQNFNVFLFLPCAKNETNIQDGINIFYCKIPFYEVYFNSKLLQGIKNKFDWLFINCVFLFKVFLMRKKINPALIYCSSSLPAPSAFFLSKVLNVPSVTRLYGTFLYRYVNSFIGQLKHLEEVLAFKLPAKLYIITNDGSYGDDVARRYKISDEKVRFWINGVNKPVFLTKDAKEKARKELDIKENDFILLTVSRLVGWKKVDRSVRALKNVIVQRRDVKLIIVGDGADRKKLDDLVKDLNLTSNIKFVGAVPHKEINNFFSIADVFISMYDLTNMGNPLSEAMSFGLPIITLGVGGTDEIVTNDKNGILIPFSADENQIVENLSTEIINLISNESLRKRLGENAKRFASENFITWDERINMEIEEIRKLIK